MDFVVEGLRTGRSAEHPGELERGPSSLEYKKPVQFRPTIGYANVENKSKERFPPSHSREDDGEEDKSQGNGKFQLSAEHNGGAG